MKSIFGIREIPVGSDVTTTDGYLRFRADEHDNSLAAIEIVRVAAKYSRSILEIGVSLYSPERSFSHQILSVKPAEANYLGVDIVDRSSQIGHYPDAHFLCCSSFEQEKVRSRLTELGMTYLDLLLIDGNHSVNACLNDWRYADLVMPGGVVLIHDTNSHPGPKAIVQAIDRNLFDVDEPLANVRDYGIAICRRKVGMFAWQ